MNKKNKRGFTLIELMGASAVIAVIGIIIVFSLGYFMATGGTIKDGNGNEVSRNQQGATEAAIRMASSMGFHDAAVSCMAATVSDHKHDIGRVPCTMAVPNPRGGLPLIYGLECAGYVNPNGQEGCRIVSQPLQPAQ